MNQTTPEPETMIATTLPNLPRRAMLQASVSLGVLVVGGRGGGSTASAGAVPLTPGQPGGSVTTTTTQPSTGKLPAWLTGNPVFAWVTLPSLSASMALPNPPLPGITGVSSVTDAWGGGALRVNGSYYILHGGGHGDYSGNEIYVLQLSADAPQWQRIWGPTPASDITPATVRYADGNPPSIHGYYMLQHIASTDTFMRFGSGEYTVGGISVQVDGWAWGATNWHPVNTYANLPTSYGYPWGSAKDSQGNVYIVLNNYTLYRWGVATNSWTSVMGLRTAVFGGPLVYDSLRNILWSWGGTGAPYMTTGQVYKLDLNTLTASVFNMTGNGATAFYAASNGYGAGAAYDPVADKIFLYDGTGTLYQFDPATLSCSIVITTGTPPPDSIQSGSHTAPHGKFQYVPELAGCVIQPLWSASTYFLRTH